MPCSTSNDSAPLPVHCHANLVQVTGLHTAVSCGFSDCCCHACAVAQLIGRRAEAVASFRAAHQLVRATEGVPEVPEAVVALRNLNKALKQVRPRAPRCRKKPRYGSVYVIRAFVAHRLVVLGGEVCKLRGLHIQGAKGRVHTASSTYTP